MNAVRNAKKTIVLLAGSFSLLLCFGCAHPVSLTMSPERPLVDNSASSQELAKTKYRKIMVIPPQGTVRGEFDQHVAIFEREFLKKGITVISAAVTGRVVLESSDKEEKGGGGAVGLSDVERALVMAKESGADAILQIGSFKWTKWNPEERERSFNPETRFFIHDRNDVEYHEVTRQEFRNSSGHKITFRSPDLRFIGRLIDVQTGEVRASFDIENAANWNMPQEYLALVKENSKGPQGYITRESYSYARADWLEIERVTMERTIQQIVNRF